MLTLNLGHMHSWIVTQKAPPAVTANPKAGEAEHGNQAATHWVHSRPGSKATTVKAAAISSPGPRLLSHPNQKLGHIDSGLLCHDRDHHENRASTDGNFQAAQ